MCTQFHHRYTHTHTYQPYTYCIRVAYDDGGGGGGSGVGRWGDTYTKLKLMEIEQKGNSSDNWSTFTWTQRQTIITCEMKRYEIA